LKKGKSMGALPVLQQGRDVPVCLSNDHLPDFYMEDYSVLGLFVASLDRAHQLLRDKDFTVHKSSDYLAVKIDSAHRISEIVDLLSQNGIDCGIADIIDQVYQG
jgi:hypothetical protein